LVRHYATEALYRLHSWSFDNTLVFFLENNKYLCYCVSLDIVTSL